MRPGTAAVCTIVAKNYLAHARCLAESFAMHHPDGRMFVLLVDDADGCFDPAAEPFTVVPIAALALPNFAQMAFRYSVLELSTAVKPFFMAHLFEHAGLDRLIYLDPDIYCYRPLTPLFDALQERMVALTPHLLAPLDDDRRPSELDILRAGPYNLGCIGLARHPELARFLRWWQRHLERNCVVDLASGLFVDQGWIGLVPSLFDGVAIVRDDGCNVAYWNLAQRRIVAGADGWTVNGRPLTFFHYSGLDLDDLERISIHQNRSTLGALPELRPLFEHYAGRLLANGHAATRCWRYSYASFDNGVPIPELVRRLWRDADGEQRWPAPFAASAPNSLFVWLNQEADRPSGDGLVLSNLALEVYRQRVDLQQAFPDVLGAHRHAYLEWFVRDAAWQAQLDRAFIDPLAPSHAVGRNGRAAPLHAASTPGRWPLATRLRALRQPLPEEALFGAPTLSRRVYYGVRNPLRRIGLHRPLKRLLGVEAATRILEAMVIRPAAAKPATRAAQPGPAPFGAVQPARGLNLVGYLQHTTGVGEVARSLLRTLEAADYPVVGIESPASDQARPGVQPGPYTCNLLCVNADTTALVQRALGAAFFAQRYTIGFWHWETTSFPAEWLDRCARLDELWVASSFVRETLAALVPIPLRTMPVPIAIDPSLPLRRGVRDAPDDRFVWLFAFDMRSYLARKNPHAVIEAYRRAFGARSTTTRLVIKAQHMDAYPQEAARLCDDLASVGGQLIGESIDRTALNVLFAACDAYVSLHRCEGFGLTIAEAMAHGKPVVATGYSGNMEYMTPANSYPVRYRLAELDRDHGPYRRGTHWAEPDLDHAAALMRQVYENRDEAREKGSAAAADIERVYGSQPVARAVIDRLRQIEHER